MRAVLHRVVTSRFVIVRTIFTPSVRMPALYGAAPNDAALANGVLLLSTQNATYVYDVASKTLRWEYACGRARFSADASLVAALLPHGGGFVVLCAIDGSVVRIGDEFNVVAVAAALEGEIVVATVPDDAARIDVATRSGRKYSVELGRDRVFVPRNDGEFTVTIRDGRPSPVARNMFDYASELSRDGRALAYATPTSAVLTLEGTQTRRFDVDRPSVAFSGDSTKIFVAGFDAICGSNVDGTGPFRLAVEPGVGRSLSSSRDGFKWFERFGPVHEHGFTLAGDARWRVWDAGADATPPRAGEFLGRTVVRLAVLSDDGDSYASLSRTGRDFAILDCITEFDRVRAAFGAAAGRAAPVGIVSAVASFLS